MNIKGVDHIAVLVKDINKAVEDYKNVLGAKVSDIFVSEENGVKGAFVDLVSTKLELIQPLEGSSLEGVLEKRGEGLHHICLEVDDVDKSLAELKQKGVRLIDEKARKGAEAPHIGFIHPKALNKVLVELADYKE